MKKTLSAITLTAFMAAGSQVAAAPAIFSSEKIDAAVEKVIINNSDFEKSFSVEAKKRGRTLDAKFIAVAAGSYLAAGFDVETTDRTIGACQEYQIAVDPNWQCIELGSLPKLGQEHGGKGGHYAVNMGLTTGVLGLSYLMKRSKEPALNKVLWWVLPVGLAAIYTRAGIINMNSYNEYHQLIRDHK